MSGVARYGRFSFWLLRRTSWLKCLQICWPKTSGLCRLLLSLQTRWLWGASSCLCTSWIFLHSVYMLVSTAGTCTAVSGSILFGVCVAREIQSYLDFLESTLYALYPAVFGVSIWSDSRYALSWPVLASIEKQRNLDFSGNDVRCAAWFNGGYTLARPLA